MYVDERSMQLICNQLNDEGRVTIHGRKFTINSVRHILKNDAYVGKYRYADTVIEGGMPVIVDKKLFDEAEHSILFSELKETTGGEKCSTTSQFSAL